MRKAGFRLTIPALMLGAALAAPALAQEAQGAQVFADYCAACHNDGGTGNPGLAPALARPDFWDAFGAKGPDYVAGVLAVGLMGTISAAGETYAGLIMPPQDALTEAEAAAAANWMLHEAGRTQPTTDLPAVTPEMIAKARAERPSAHDLIAMRPEG